MRTAPASGPRRRRPREPANGRGAQNGTFQLPPLPDFSLKKIAKQASEHAEHAMIKEAGIPPKNRT